MKKLLLVLSLLIVAGISSLATLIFCFVESENKKTHPIEKFKNEFSEFKDLTPRDRIKPLSNSKVIEYFNRDSINNIVPLEELTKQETSTLNKLYQAIELWPLIYKDYLWDKVARIYIVDGLFSSGMARYIEKGNAHFILINRKLLSLKPNDWATQTEESCFYYNNLSDRLFVEIEQKTDSYLTLENVLIHELGHVIAIDEEITPDYIPRKLGGNYPFFKDAFYSDINKMHRKPNNKIINLTYYARQKDKVTFDDYYNLSKELKNTDYPTIYGISNQDEYFAEYFYLFFHCNIQGKNFRAYYHKNGLKELLIDNPLTKERCFDRIMLLINELHKLNYTQQSL